MVVVGNPWHSLDGRHSTIIWPSLKSVSKFPSSHKDASHWIGIHLIQYDPMLTWLHQQRPYFQVKAHSQRAGWEKKIYRTHSLFFLSSPASAPLAIIEPKWNPKGKETHDGVHPDHLLQTLSIFINLGFPVSTLRGKETKTNTILTLQSQCLGEQKKSPSQILKPSVVSRKGT